MVSRFLWLNFIWKGKKSVSFPVIEGNLWSPLNQISTRDSALILELEVKWFKSHWCSKLCFRTQPLYNATHGFFEKLAYQHFRSWNKISVVPELWPAYVAIFWLVKRVYWSFPNLKFKTLRTPNSNVGKTLSIQ